jgi:hypothetical protein
MASDKQHEANRQNALKSTGPTTSAGKARSSRNALHHGAFSTLPVVPGLERNEDWEAHRAGIFNSLIPVGVLEEALAERVATCLWRLNRIHRYETAVTSVGLERIADQLRPRRPVAKIALPGLEPDEEEDLDTLEPEEALGKTLREVDKVRETMETWEGTRRLLEQLPELPDEAPVDGDDAYGVFEDLLGALPEDGEYPDLEDPDLLAALGIPEDELDEAYAWHGWTAGMVRQGVAELANYGDLTPEQLLAMTLRARQKIQDQGKATLKTLEATVKALRWRIKVKEDRIKRERMLPDAHTLQKITRYEAHLSRQLYQALHELQRLQAARDGQHVPLPAALDVVVTGASGEDISEVFAVAKDSMDK